jgi:hypothetical protein
MGPKMEPMFPIGTLIRHGLTLKVGPSEQMLVWQLMQGWLGSGEQHMQLPYSSHMYVPYSTTWPPPSAPGNSL